MNRIAVQSASLPSWKNSPIKTIPGDLRKFVVEAEKPPLHRHAASLPRGTTPVESSKLLKDVSSMFDDDGDRTEAEDDKTAERSEPRVSIDGCNQDAMRAMFCSPSQSVNNSFNAQQSGREYYWDRNNVVDEDSYVIGHQDTSIDYPADDLHSSFIFRSTLQEVAQQAAAYSYSTSDSVDLQHELKHNSFLQEHIAFLTNFDRELNTHISKAQSSAVAPIDESVIDYERELVEKLDHYLQLPTGVLSAMVDRQHQDLVESGLLDT